MIDCAFDRENGCACLTIKQCAIGKPCSFRKNNAALLAGREKAAKRIASLDANEQAYIEAHYYGSKKVKRLEDTL